MARVYYEMIRLDALLQWLMGIVLDAG